MNATTTLRAKYKKRLTSAGQLRHAPGGADVLRLCDLCDRLEQIIRHAQRQLTTEQQNEIDRMLWAAGITP